jgi:hypothetical protein
MNFSGGSSGCGMVNAPKEAINLYFQMRGLSPTPRLFDELMRGWRGFTLTGEEADEGSNELKRNPKLVNPRAMQVYQRLHSCSEPQRGRSYPQAGPVKRG